MGQDPAMLLRMLEPPVRPVGSGPVARPAVEPFEGRGFESLLREAQQGAQGPSGMFPGDTGSRQDAAAGNGVAEATGFSHALRPLSGLGTIENATLRQLMAQRAAAKGD